MRPRDIVKPLLEFNDGLEQHKVGKSAVFHRTRRQFVQIIEKSRLSEREQIDEEGGRVVALRTSAASQIPVPTVNRSRNTWIGFLAFFLSKGNQPPFLPA